MSTELVLVLLSPLLLLVLVGGVVAVVALVKADSKDVPEVAHVWCSLFRKLAERTPKIANTNMTTAPYTPSDERRSHEDG